MNKEFFKNIIFLMLILVSTGTMVSCGKKNEESETKEDLIAENTIEITAISKESFNINEFKNPSLLRKVQQKTNVRINLEEVSKDVWKEKEKELLEDKELPDIIFGNDLSQGYINALVEKKLIMPLDELMEDYAPNLKKILLENPEIKESITNEDGHIYSIPYIEDIKSNNIGPNFFINKTWLDKLKLEVPKTIEDFYKVMKIFKTKDPNGNGEDDEIPFTYISNNDILGENALFSSFGVMENEHHLYIKDDMIMYAPLEDGYRECIIWLSKMYQQELIHEDVFTNNLNDYKGINKDGDSKIGAFIAYFDEDIVGEKNAKNDYIALPPLFGPNKEKMWIKLSDKKASSRFLLTKSNENLVETIKLIDYLYKEDGIISEQCTDILDSSKVQRKIERNENIYEEYTLLDPLPELYFTNEELRKIFILEDKLNNYINDVKEKWIKGERRINREWDIYKENLLSMGAKELIDIYQRSYNRYKEK